MLPQWLNDFLPAEREPRLLTKVDESWVIHSPTGKEESFSSLKEVAALDSPEGLIFGGELVKEHYLTYSVGTNVGMIIPRSDQKRKEVLEIAYEEAITAIHYFLKKPNDFFRAWTMVDLHPAFWVLVDSANPWFWETNGHANRVSVYPSPGKVSLETGGHLLPDSEKPYEGHYYDWRLDSSDKTFEKAFIQLAAEVYNIFENDGSERKVPLTKAS